MQTIDTARQIMMRLVSIAFLFLFPAVGLLVACIGFCDPDTCWHLALGKWIFTHHGLPHVDPFSSNVFHAVFVAENLPLMQHEWLSDLVFYCVFAAFGLIGLLVFTAIVSICSFIIMPSILMLRNGVPGIVALPLMTLALCAASFRLWVRPEEFSFLFMSALIIINDICQTTTNRRLVTACYAAVFSIMSLWVNFHGLFFVGLAYLIGYCLFAPINIKRAVITVMVALVGTLNTPWHFQFWQYIYKLAGSPITYGNRENGPITINDLSHPAFIPLCLLLVLVWSTLLWCALRKKGILKVQLLPLGLSLCATVAIIACHRLTPLALLVLFAAVSKTFKAVNDHSAAAEFYIPGGWVVMLIGIAACGLTCFVTTTCFIPPCLPAASRLFHPPYAAIQYLEHHQQKGRLLNDSKFGSMMTWDMTNPPDIFIDGRFDSFDRELVYDYNKMRLCKDNWQQLLDKYKIAWLFFPPKTPIVIELMTTKQWQVEYIDDKAVVLSHI